MVSIKIQGRQTSLRPQLTWYCSQIVVGRGGDCCCRPPLHNPPTDRSATRANRDARTQHTSIFFVPCLPPPSGECGAESSQKKYADQNKGLIKKKCWSMPMYRFLCLVPSFAQYSNLYQYMRLYRLSSILNDTNRYMTSLSPLPRGCFGPGETSVDLYRYGEQQGCPLGVNNHRRHFT